MQEEEDEYDSTTSAFPTTSLSPRVRRSAVMLAVIAIVLVAVAVAEERSFFLDHDDFAGVAAGQSELTCPYTLLKDGERTDTEAVFAVSDVIEKMRAHKSMLSTSEQVGARFTSPTHVAQAD